MVQESDPFYYTRKQFAGVLSISLKTVDKLRKNGAIPSFTVCNTVRIPKEAVDVLVAKSTASTAKLAETKQLAELNISVPADTVFEQRTLEFLEKYKPEAGATESFLVDKVMKLWMHRSHGIEILRSMRERKLVGHQTQHCANYKGSKTIYFYASNSAAKGK